MVTQFSSILVAALAGVAMALQGSLNSALGKVVGLLQATFIVHIIGGLAAGLLLLAPLSAGSLAKTMQAPWYTFLGGVLGVMIIYGVVTSIPRLGVAVATTAIIVGQVGAAMLIDHLGLFGLERMPFTWSKLGGLVLLAVGARLMLN